MNIKKILGLSVFLTVLSVVIFQGLQTQALYAATASNSVIVTLQVTTGISLSAPPNVLMSTNLGVSQNTADATTTWTTSTNDALGYALTMAASTRPAMQSGANSIADYSTTTMPSTWNVTSGDARFGFSVFGSDVNTATWGTDTLCNNTSGTSTISANLKYYGFYTTATTVATRSSTTTPTGVNTTVCYAVQQGTSNYIPSGTYTATITGTATSL